MLGRKMILVCGLAAVLASAPVALAEAVGTEWTYQGQLKQDGAPADGTYDMRFRLYDAVTVGNQIGPMLTFNGLVDNPEPVSVVDGLFTVELDFGAIYDGTALWLEIDVRPHLVGFYNTLSPRQPLTATPFALYALGGGDGCCWEINGDDVYYDVGSVGIGIADPEKTLLHVGTGDGELLKLGQSPSLIFTRDVANSEFRINLGGTGYNGKILQLGRDDGNHNIYMTGNVGIGTTSPAVKLHVSGGTDASLGGGGYIQAGSQTAANVVFDDNEIMARNNGAAATLAINNDGGNVHLIPTGTGKVGIGTNTPAARLDVQSVLPNEVIGRLVKSGPSNTDGLYVETDGSALPGGTIHAVNKSAGPAVWAQNDSGGVTTALVAQRPLASAGTIAEFLVGNTAMAWFDTAGDLHFPQGGNIWLYGGFVRFGDGTTQASAANIVSEGVVVDPPSLTSGANAVITVTVDGAVVGDAVVANPGANFSASYAISFVRVSAADTVSIGLINPSPVTVNPGSSTWRFRIIK